MRKAKRYCKKLLILCLALCFVFAGAAMPYAATISPGTAPQGADSLQIGKTAYVIDGKVHVKADASHSSETLVTLEEETEVSVTGIQGKWSKVMVSTGNRTYIGYVPSERLDFTPPIPPFSPFTGYVITDGKIYKEASSSSAVVESVWTNVVVSVKETNYEGWYYVTLTLFGKSISGWINEYNVSPTKLPEETTIQTGTSTASPNLLVRAGPGKQYDILAQRPPGTVVQIHSVSGDWYYLTTTVNGVAIKGYAHGDYITLNNHGVAGYGPGTTAARTLTEGATYKMIHTAAPSQLRYSTSDANVATVNASGVITAKKLGTAKITATFSDGKTSVFTITVIDKKALSCNQQATNVAATNSRVTKVPYGTSDQGRQLESFIINGTGNNSKTIFLVFTIHGFEDEYYRDGAILTQLANNVVTYYANNPAKLGNYRMIVVPVGNPDGLIAGTNNWRAGNSGAFGRCTKAGIDMNRDFINSKFHSRESLALKYLMQMYKMNVHIDFHGWEDSVLGNGTIVSSFRSKVGLTTDKTGRYGAADGYTIGWTNSQLSAKSALVEFKNSKSVNANNVYNALNDVMTKL